MQFYAFYLPGRTDGPCLVESLGGSILTLISQHMLSLPKSAVAIGDFNSNVRILLLPETLSSSRDNETEVIEFFLYIK